MPTTFGDMMRQWDEHRRDCVACKTWELTGAFQLCQVGKLLIKELATILATWSKSGESHN